MMEVGSTKVINGSTSISKRKSMNNTNQLSDYYHSGSSSNGGANSSAFYSNGQGGNQQTPQQQYQQLLQQQQYQQLLQQQALLQQQQQQQQQQFQQNTNGSNNPNSINNQYGIGINSLMNNNSNNTNNQNNNFLHQNSNPITLIECGKCGGKKRHSKTCIYYKRTEDEDFFLSKDLIQKLDVIALKRYKKYYRLKTKHNSTKAELASAVRIHFDGLPVNEPEIIETFMCKVKNAPI